MSVTLSDEEFSDLVESCYKNGKAAALATLASEQSQWCEIADEEDGITAHAARVAASALALARDLIRGDGP